MNLAGVEEIIKLRRQLDSLQDKLEDRIGRLQGQLQERMRGIASALPAPAEDVTEDGA